MAPVGPSQPAAAVAPLRWRLDGQPSRDVLLLDRGLHYGDGLFETLLIRDGQPCQWALHQARLERGCHALGFAPIDGAALRAEADALIAGAPMLNAEVMQGILKILLTRGSGGRGYRPDPAAVPRSLLLLYPPPAGDGDAPWSTGVEIRWCRATASVNAQLAGLKHLNRLDSVLARAEWSQPGIAEGLMCDDQGLVVGGTMTNLFLWSGGALRTPAIVHAGIRGTVRDLVMELARHAGLSCTEAAVSRAEVEHAEGLFLTNAVIGVWPVRQLGERTFRLDTLPWPLLEAVRETARRAG